MVLMSSEIDPSAVETMTIKRRLESSSAALAVASPKRPCAGTDTDTDSFEEFFALLQRIKNTERHCSLKSRGAAARQEPAVKCIEAGKVDGAKAVTPQAPWRPSFEWEDFLPRGNGTHDVEGKAGEQNWKGGEHEGERFSPETSLDREKCLDLNLPLALMPL